MKTAIITLLWIGYCLSQSFVPAWHSDALWAVPAVKDAGSGAQGAFLGGPKDETISGLAINAQPLVGTLHSGPYGYIAYDSLLGRIHLVAGNSSVRGYMDGPFSRARTTGYSYSQVRQGASNGRYAYITEPQNSDKIRRFDFVDQMVTTVPLTVNVAGMTVGSDGKLYIKSHYDSLLHIVSLDGSVERKTLAMVEGTGNFVGLSMVLDEAKNRIYASTYRPTYWYVHYWDLSDGSFHGVLPVTTDSLILRERNVPGPFEGTNLYPQLGIFFGPDDPEKRYLYIDPNDTWVILRLDLQERVVATSSKESDGVRFITSGNPKKLDGYTGRFNSRGDIITDIIYWELPKYVAYKRIR